METLVTNNSSFKNCSSLTKTITQYLAKSHSTLTIHWQWSAFLGQEAELQSNTLLPQGRTLSFMYHTVLSLIWNLICTSELLKNSQVQINSEWDKKNCMITNKNMKKVVGESARTSFLKNFFPFEKTFFQISTLVIPISHNPIRLVDSQV